MTTSKTGPSSPRVISSPNLLPLSRIFILPTPLERVLGPDFPASKNIQDRREYDWGSNPVRENLASGLGLWLGMGGQLPGMLGFTGQNAGVLENQLGLGDIPRANAAQQVLGMVQKAPEYFNEYVLGHDPTKSDMGEALRKHGEKRFDDMQKRERLGAEGKLWEEMTEAEKIKWLEARGFSADPTAPPWQAEADSPPAAFDSPKNKKGR